MEEKTKGETPRLPTGDHPSTFPTLFILTKPVTEESQAQQDARTPSTFLMDVCHEERARPVNVANQQVAWDYKLSPVILLVTNLQGAFPVSTSQRQQNVSIRERKTS